MAKFSQTDTKETVKTAMEISGLGNRLKDKAKTYSKGMKRRLLLARALMTKPKLAILDEPASGLRRTPRLPRPPNNQTIRKTKRRHRPPQQPQHARSRIPLRPRSTNPQRQNHPRRHPNHTKNPIQQPKPRRSIRQGDRLCLKASEPSS